MRFCVVHSIKLLSGTSPAQDGGLNFGFENKSKGIPALCEFHCANMRSKKTISFLTQNTEVASLTKLGYRPLFLRHLDYAISTPF